MKDTKLKRRMALLRSQNFTIITAYENTANAKSIADKRAVEIYDSYHAIAKLSHYPQRKQHLERLYHEALSL
jgi:hypothetical protein